MFKNKLNRLKDFISKNDKASMQASAIISLVIALIVLSIMMPIALSEFFLANTTGWDGSTVRLWEIIPIFAIIGIVLSVVGSVKDKF
ncbi:MAG: hypothetical protein HF967_07545 [Methanosarcinales archaeon]|nr:hypothetical protein [Methanosarcinales archaeon]